MIWILIKKNVYSGERFGKLDKVINQVDFNISLQGFQLY